MSKIFVSLDIESITNVDVVGIGLVVGNEYGKILEQKRWWISREDIDIDPRVKKEFWDIHIGPYKDWQANGKDEEEQIKGFVNFYDNIAAKYDIEEKDIILINDNPEYDFGRLAPYVYKYCKRDPLRYTTKGEYRKIIDIGQCLGPLGIWSAVDDFASKIQAHDHYPDNDAAHNYIFHILGVEVINVIKSQLEKDTKNITLNICEKKIKEFIYINKEINC